MAYTPVELRHLSLRRGLLGYRRGPVDELLADVASSFEDVWRERADLGDRVEQLEADLAHHREREALLANTLVAAERAAVDAKENARRKADHVVAEAHAEARSITRHAIAERERLLAEIGRLKALLRSVLEVVEEREQPAAAEPAARPAGWPQREDTREFERPSRPGLALSPEPKDAHAQ